ncbi:MAG: RND family efflux transporter MFP subunit [Parcubacteria group bacterium Greene0416_79]|nr:MAG: RND family efflux transporter MFP subunit [Parcubacteria group bacterium Greene0416_79]
MRFFFRQKAVYIGGIALAGLVALYFFTLSPPPPAGETVLATKKDITNEVFITGTVKARRRVPLSFDRGGVIASLPFTTGARVLPDAVLASLYSEPEEAAREEMRALVGIAEAKLKGKKQGTRSEEIQLKEAELAKAEVSLESSKDQTGTILADAYGAAEEALNRYADPLFSSDATEHARLTYAPGTEASYKAESERVAAEAHARTLRALLSPAPADPTAALEEALQELIPIQKLFITLVRTLQNGSALDGAVLGDYRTRVSNARALVTTAINAVQNHLNLIRERAAERARATRALELTNAPATSESIEEAEQELAQARAKLRAADAAVEKTVLRAPFAGRIAGREAERGETVSAGAPIVEFLGTEGFIIEAPVPEADIAKIREDDFAEVTLDAYGDGVAFPARVTLIEPAAIEIEGVPTYKTTFAFERSDPRLRSGLTANVSIKTIRKEEAVVIPARAIIQEGKAQYVQKKGLDGRIEKAPVVVGIRANPREVEIVEGVREGDRLILQESK